MPADGLQPDKTFHVTIRTWFDQTDGLGILHHSHYVLMMERAQKVMFIALMGKDTIDPAVAPDVYVVVRDIDLHYLVAIRPDIGRPFATPHDTTILVELAATAPDPVHTFKRRDDALSCRCGMMRMKEHRPPRICRCVHGCCCPSCC